MHWKVTYTNMLTNWSMNLLYLLAVRSFSVVSPVCLSYVKRPKVRRGGGIRHIDLNYAQWKHSSVGRGDSSHFPHI